MLTIDVTVIGQTPARVSGVQNGNRLRTRRLHGSLPFLGPIFFFSNSSENAEESIPTQLLVSPVAMRSIEVARRSGALARVSQATNTQIRTLQLTKTR